MADQQCTCMMDWDSPCPLHGPRERTYTAAQLSQAVEAAQNQYVYTAAQMEIERFKSKVEGSNEVLLAVLYELGYTPPEDEAIGLGRVKRELDRKLEAAQGAILEAAIKFIEYGQWIIKSPENVAARVKSVGEIRDGGQLWTLRKSIACAMRDALQTEPMAAALAHHDATVLMDGIDDCAHDGSELLVGGKEPVRIFSEAALAARYQPQPPEGHNQPCYYCGEPCNALAGNPGKWPLAFPHRDEPGVVKWQHVGCVVARLTENQPVGIAEAAPGLEAGARKETL